MNTDATEIQGAIFSGEYKDKGTGEESDYRWWAKLTYKCLCSHRHVVQAKGIGRLPEKFPAKGKCGTAVVVVPYR
jgi:hypothetical protein